ncbi:hypothetical protein C1645_816032 [Glomus cerebriforme]|uniref:Hsp70 family protein n=1 Tax=Glomus cerebriforme TaxID=658196 RepID=A0A397TCG4_9GLOM|nr:hypothetical protein C1645_816032 [Glomus cerebriforme]
MNVSEKFDKLNNRLTNLLEENNALKRLYKNLRKENQELKDKLDERDYEILQEENKKLKENLDEKERQFQDILNLEKHKNEILQEEIKGLIEKYEQSQQLIQDLERLGKQKDEELDKISQNLEKVLGKLELDESDDYDYKSDYIKLIQTENNKNIRVIVGLDFGTTHSGFSYCHVSNPKEICTNDQWLGEVGNMKANTVLQYDDEYNNVKSWGFPALATKPPKPNRRNKNQVNKPVSKPVELFKLHLGDLNYSNRPVLPDGLNFRKAITDYLREIGKLIKETVAIRWPNINFFEQVLLILTVSAEWPPISINIMRECVYNAGLITEQHSNKLQFTTEPQAVAIYCMNKLREFDLTIGSTFMVVDCGGGTVELTTRKLLANNKLSEITVRTGDYCGSTFIDEEFINFLRRILGYHAIDLLKKNNYDQLQYMVHEFCQRVKFLFTGDSSDYSPYELDVEGCAPILKEYVNGEVKEIMEEKVWLIRINFYDVKAMFDPVVGRILNLIKVQLENARETCSTIFLAGGFGASKYLQERIKQEFQHTIHSIIYTPKHPTTAVSRGATLYGLSLLSENNNVIVTRVLKYTYGIRILTPWMKGDPIERKTSNGCIIKFHCLAKCGTQVETNQEVITDLSNFMRLVPFQTKASFYVYYTREYDAKYCDEPGMNLLGKLIIELSNSSTLGRLLLTITFGELEINFTVKNDTTGQNYMTKFVYNDDYDYYDY